MNKDVIHYPAEAVAEAVERFETPFFLYEEARIRDNCRRFKGAFDRHFDDFWPIYAVKANANPAVLRVIADEGFGADASSEAEAWICDKLGIKGMYTGNYTTTETLKFAGERGFILNLDDATNLDSFGEGLIPVPELLSFRINPGIGKATNESCVTAGPDAKYGIKLEKAVEAYKRAVEMGVKRFGIHMMTGSNVPMEDQNYFGDIVRKLFEVVVAVKNVLGIEIELMNIGGGFGVPYRPEQDSLDMEEVALSVREAFDECCKKNGLREPRLMAEPGRYIVADAGWLVGHVTVIKESYRKFIGLDAASNDMPRPSIYDAYHYVSVLDKEGQPKVGETERVSVVGTICENNDQFAKDRDLPVCEVGDIVLIHNSGGHAYSMGHNYNGKLRHAEYLIELDGSLRQIRRAETIEDLYQTVDI
ncbi:diaminopimelate decarboxylase [Candidatus Peregrinibacteria bacterium]|nr:diaminopimelate decarboxylase [Candidatus Peregrinibacteria bacterium]